MRGPHDGRPDLINRTNLPVWLVVVTAMMASILAGVPPASAASDGFSGTVFSDRDWDGVWDADEGPLAGVVLEVARALEPHEALPGVVPPTLATATSGADGRYRFSGLPTDTDFLIRPAEVQPLHIDQLGFNGVFKTTFTDRYEVGADGTGVMQDFHDITAIDIGISRYHEVNIDAWVDLDGDGVMDAGEPAPSGYHADLLNGIGATVDTNIAYYDSRTVYLAINEASTAFAVRAKTDGTETAIVGFDSDGGADGDILITRGGGRTAPTYQVMFAAADDFGGVIDGCSVTQPADWAIEAVTDPVSAQVWRLYSAFLLRQPERSGFDYWLGIRSGGSSHVVVAESFALSTEFVNRYGSLTDAQYVRLLYRNVLCREPDPAGFNYWLLALRYGLTRGEAMLYFSEGAEYLGRTGTAHPLLP